MARTKGAAAEQVRPPDRLRGAERDVGIDEVRRHPKNARAGNVEAIKASIRANGFYGRLLVRKATMEICLGNHRWQAMRELGAKKVPVEVLDITEREALKILAVDNRASDLAGYDEARLADLLKSIQAEGDLVAVGYSDDDLERIVASLEPKVAPGDFKDLDPGGMHLVRHCPKCGFDF
jgi:ParB-like chromosome segregation protein Spo0J